MTASLDLLRDLLARRDAAGEDREAVERLIFDTFQETWCVAFTDLEGFSRGVEDFGILHFLGLIHRQRELLAPEIARRGGLLLKEEADSWLVLFRDPRVAVDAFLACRRLCSERNRHRPPHEQLRLGVGIGYGPVLKIGDHDVWGLEVNLASKLGEEVAQGGDILLSEGAAAALGAAGGTFSLRRREERLGTLHLVFFQVEEDGAGREER